MPAPIYDRTIVRPTPAPTTGPQTLPPYVRERNQAVDEWCRQAQLAIQQLQEKVKALEAANE